MKYSVIENKAISGVSAAVAAAGEMAMKAKCCSSWRNHRENVKHRKRMWRHERKRRNKAYGGSSKCGVASAASQQYQHQ